MILFQAAVPFLAGVLLAAFGGAGAWPIVALGGVGICIGALLTGKHKEAAMPFSSAMPPYRRLTGASSS